MFIGIQHSSGIAAKGYQHMPLRTGYDQVIPHRVTDLYAFGSKEDGVVKEVSSEHLLVEYASGKLIGVELGKRFGRAEGTVIPHTVVTDVKPGQTFKRGEILAWNSGWFVRDFWNPTQVLWKSATLLRTAILDTGETYEDSGAISKKATRKLRSDLSKVVTLTFKKDQKVSQLVTVGTKLETESILCTIEDSLTANTGLFNDDNIDLLRAFSSQTPRAHCEGVVDKIEVFYRGDVEDMSESLQAIINTYDRERARLAKKLRRDDATTGRVLDRVRIDGIPLEEDHVAVRLTITHEEDYQCGDKNVFALQLKSVTGEVFEGENYTESGVEIEAKFSNMSIFNRIVGSAPTIGFVTTVLLEISKQAAEIYRGKR